MGTEVVFTVEARTPAPPPVVWDLVRDGTTWPTWTPIGRFELEREGRDGGESPGAIRVFRTGPGRSREEIVEVVPEQRLSYCALSGLPISDHRADLELTPAGGGTAILWRERYTPKPVSGLLVTPFLKAFMRRCVNGLARRATELAARQES